MRFNLTYCAVVRFERDFSDALIRRNAYHANLTQYYDMSNSNECFSRILMNVLERRSILKNSEKPAPAVVGSVGVLGRVEGR